MDVTSNPWGLLLERLKLPTRNNFLHFNNQMGYDIPSRPIPNLYEKFKEKIQTLGNNPRYFTKLALLERKQAKGEGRTLRGKMKVPCTCFLVEQYP